MLGLLDLEVCFLKFFIQVFNSFPTQFCLFNQAFVVLHMFFKLILHSIQLIAQVLNL